MNAFNARLARRRRSRALLFLTGLVATFCLLMEPAGASWAVYFEGNLAYNTYYQTPGYWSYTQNWVDGTYGVTYWARMRNSSGFTLAEGGANDSVILYYYGGQLVSPGCKHTRSGGGSAYTSCWAWY